jgi:hypothetical protein
MTTTFKTVLLAGAAALVVALGGAAAAQAGDYNSALLGTIVGDGDSYADSESNPITEAVEAAATEAAVETLLGDGLDD